MPESRKRRMIEEEDEVEEYATKRISSSGKAAKDVNEKVSQKLLFFVFEPVATKIATSINLGGHPTSCVRKNQ